MSSKLKSFDIVVADTVFYEGRILALTQDDAYDEAVRLFQSDGRDRHFTDRCETDVLVKEVHS